jgi:hypothetical protein
VHAATAIWDIAGGPEAPRGPEAPVVPQAPHGPEAAVVLEVLLQAWQANPYTGNAVAACLRRMGSAAAPALPRIRAELARPERGGHFGTVDGDEELVRALTGLLPVE